MVSIFPLLQAAATFSREYTGAWGMLGAGVGAGLAVIGAGIGQPEMAGRIQTGAIIFAALIEGVALFAIVISFLIQGKFKF